MHTIKGPGLFIGQFADDVAPFNTLPGMASWAADLGFKGLQLPSWDPRFIDVAKAAESATYCDETNGVLVDAGVQITDLASHIQGQLCAVHPAHDLWLDGLAPEHVRGNPAARQAWAVEQLMTCLTASKNLGLTTLGTFPGTLLWPYWYPFPQLPDGLVNEGYDELARIWRPILDHADAQGIDLCFEIHPMEDLFDGTTFEIFLEKVDNHPRCQINYDPSHLLKQGLDYLEFIDIYHERIKTCHVKDSEFNPTGRQGFLSGMQPWLNRAARDRSLGDGQTDFKGIFSRFTQYEFPGWAVYEWECCIKSPEQGAREGAEFIKRHIIETTTKVFDDFAGTQSDRAANRQMLGLSE
ncbi:MAG: sugar phosphate isomerase/epimerase [Pseudomonadota bacterium]